MVPDQLVVRTVTDMPKRGNQMAPVVNAHNHAIPIGFVEGLRPEAGAAPLRGEGLHR